MITTNFEVELNALQAALAGHLKRYGYKPTPRLDLFKQAESNEDFADRVGAAVMAFSITTEEAATKAAWAAIEGNYVKAQALRGALMALTGLDVWEIARKGSGKELPDLDGAGIGILKEDAMTAGRMWAAEKLADALHQADIAYKEVYGQPQTSPRGQPRLGAG